MSKPVVIYRWFVFLLAAGYCIRMIVFSDWGPFAGPFRFLTIWALFMSFFAASRMMALIEGRSIRRWDGFVSATAVINAMVCYLYWSLFLNDPASVTRNGQLSEPYLEIYLHGVGPLLQFIDAAFIHRAFRKLGHAALWLVSVVAAYILWMELVLQPLNTTPRGTVTSGLSYPFLNSMPPDDRLVFYAGNFAAGLVLLGVMAMLAWVVRRVLPQPTAPASRPDNQGI